MQRKLTQSTPCKLALLTLIALALFASICMQTNLASAATAKSQRVYDVMAGHQVWDSITISNNIGYVGTVDGQVYALDLATGQLVWGPIATGDEFNGAPTVDGGVVYLAGTHGGLYAFNAAQSSLQQLWSITVNSALFGAERFYNSPTASGGLLYIAGMNGGFYVFAEGASRPDSALWSYQTDWGTGGSHVVDQFESPVIVDNGVAYLASLNGYVCTFTASSTPQTAPLWHFKLGDYFMDSPAVSDGVAYLAGQGGHIYAFPASASSPVNRFLWNRTLYDSFYSSPSVYGGAVYLAGYKGTLYATNISSGRQLWDFNVGGHFDGSSVAVDGVLYVENVNGSVCAFPAGSSRPTAPLWSVSTSDSFYGSVAVDNNIVYAIGEQGIIYAFADNVSVTFIETGLLAGTSWNVTLDGVTQTSTNQTVSFSVFPNGQHNYSIGLPIHYLNNSRLTGSVSVLGQKIVVPVAFSGAVATIKIAFVNANITAGGNQTIIVEGYDYYGNYVGPVTANMSISSASGGSIIGGVASATVAGVWNITAVYQGAGTASATLTVAPAALNRIVMSSPNGSIVAGGSQAFTVKGYDAYGNSVNPANVTFSLPSAAGGSVIGGVVSATKAGVWTVTVTCPGIADATVALNVTAASLDHLSINMPSSFTAGSQVKLSVEGFDIYGNTLGPVAANVVLSNGANGFVNGSLFSVTAAGNWTLSASLPGLNSTSISFSVTPDVLSRLVITSQSNSIVAGGNQSYAATGYDRYNNSLGAVPAQFTISPGAGGSANGSQVSATLAGLWNVTASYQGVTATTSLSVAAGSLDHMGINSSMDSIVAGASSSLSAEGFDAYGNSLGALPATFSIPADAGGSVNGNQVTATKAGQWPITVSYPGMKDMIKPLTVTPGDLDHIKITSPIDGITAGDSKAFSAEGFDHYGNDLGPIDAAYSVSPNAGGKVDGNKVSATKAGTWTVTAAKDGVTALTPLKVNPGPATKFTVTKNSAVAKVDNSIYTYYVTAEDDYGNTATGYNGKVWLDCNDSDTYIPSCVTLIGGIAEFNATSTDDDPSIFASTTEKQSTQATPEPTETPIDPTVSPTPSPTDAMPSFIVYYSSFDKLVLIAVTVIVIALVMALVRREKARFPKKFW